MDLKTAIYRYCNYQERCHKEVRNKLYELGATSHEVQQLITEVIEAGLLNEERYAKAYARGRFRIKHWGRQKIVQQLKLNQVSAYCIKAGLGEIDPDEYYKTLNHLAERKISELRTEKNLFVKKQKTYRYLLQKGFEADLINTIIQDIMTKD